MDPAPTSAPEDREYPHGQGHRCGSCEQIILDEWLNWQKCWAEPYNGENGKKRILAFPSGRDPTTFLLDSQETIGTYSFWWFFLCKHCRVRFRAHALCVENKEIVNETINVPITWASSSGEPGTARQFLQ